MIPKWVGYIIVAISFVLMLATAGASDAEMIGFNEVLGRMIVLIASAGIGVFIVEWARKDEEKERF